MKKATVALRSFANILKNSTFCVDYQIRSSDNRVGMKTGPVLEGYVFDFNLRMTLHKSHTKFFQV
jgi:hypothetical protein